MIRQASPVLYKATRDRAYFRRVHILVPESWNHIEANITSWEIFEVSSYKHIRTARTRKISRNVTETNLLTDEESRRACRF